MRAVLLVAVCFLISSSAFAADQQVKNAAPSTAAKPVAIALATKPAHKAVQSAKTEVPVRVWTLEMSCCEPQ
jgi:uncharacterized protein YdeI (BOF family)